MTFAFQLYGGAALKFVTPPSLAGIILYEQNDLVGGRKRAAYKH
jgi:hypothetical protein